MSAASELSNGATAASNDEGGGSVGWGTDTCKALTFTSSELAEHDLNWLPELPSPGEQVQPGSSDAGSASSGERKRLPLKTKIVLGLGESVQGIHVMIAGYYLNSFLLETACIDPMYVGLMQAVQGWFDTVNDPFIGLLSDRTRTRWGRRRPWLLFGGPFLAVFYFGLWNALPPTVPQFWKFMYAVVVYMGVSVGITSVQVQIGALVPELTDDYDERTNVSGWRLGMANLLGLVAALSHNQMVTLQPSADPQAGFRMSGGIFAIVLWCCTWITFVGIRERFNKRQESRKQMRIREEFRAVVTNKAFLCVSGAYFCGPTAVVLVQSNLLMFCKYQLNDPSIITRIIPCVQGVGLLCIPFWVWLASRLDKRYVYLLAGALLVLGVSSIYFVRTEAAALGLGCLIGSCLAIPYLIPYSMLPDVIDEDELRTGKRREGIFVGFFTIMLKMSVTGALTLTNFVLKAVGYQAPHSVCSGVPNTELDLSEGPVQPEIVTEYIRHLCSTIPAVFLLAATVLAWLCPITRGKQAAMAKLAAQARLERCTQQSETSSVTSTHSPRDVKALADFISETGDNEAGKVLDAMVHEYTDARFQQYQEQEFTARQSKVRFELPADSHSQAPGSRREAEHPKGKADSHSLASTSAGMSAASMSDRGSSRLTVSSADGAADGHQHSPRAAPQPARGDAEGLSLEPRWPSGAHGEGPDSPPLEQAPETPPSQLLAGQQPLYLAGVEADSRRPLEDQQLPSSPHLRVVVSL